MNDQPEEDSNEEQQHDEESYEDLLPRQYDKPFKTEEEELADQSIEDIE